MLAAHAQQHQNSLLEPAATQRAKKLVRSLVFNKSNYLQCVGCFVLSLGLETLGTKHLFHIHATYFKYTFL